MHEIKTGDGINSYIVSFQGSDAASFERFAGNLNRITNKECRNGKWIISSQNLGRVCEDLEPSMLSITPNTPIGEDLKMSLFPYQKDVVDFCLNAGKGIIVAPCGAGKTPIGIDIFIDAKKRGLIDSDAVGLIVVKATLKVQWFKEVSKFSNLKASILNTYNAINPTLRNKIKKEKKNLEPLLKNPMANYDKIARIDSVLKKMEDEFEAEFSRIFGPNIDLLIANYETLRDAQVRAKLHKINLQYIFADEAHYLKNDTASRSKALYEFSDVKLKIGATATPIQKNPLDIYSITKFISPDTFKSKAAFSARYLQYSVYRNIIGSQNEEELFRKLSDFMIVKSKEEVSKQLPKLFPITRYCKLEPKQLQMTEKLLAEIKELKEEENKIQSSVSADKNERLLQIQANILARQTFASELATSEELLSESDSDLAKRYTTGSKSNKIEMLLDLLEDIFDSGEKAVVFSKYRRLQEILTREINNRFSGIKIAYINGEMSSVDRYKEAYDKFRNMDEYKVLLCSNSAAEGVNLSKARYLIEMEPADSYLIQTQRRGRIERADSVFDTVYAYQLVAEKSYDEIALRIIEKKERYDAEIIQRGAN